MKSWVVLALLLPLLAAAQALNVKVGAWEMTYKSPTLPRPMVEKECVTKSDVAQLAAGTDKDDDDQCKYTKPPTIAGNKWSADKKCADGRKVHAEFVADSPERVSGTIASAAANGSQTVRMEIAGRWLGASCAGIK